MFATSFRCRIEMFLFLGLPCRCSERVRMNVKLLSQQMYQYTQMGSCEVYNDWIKMIDEERKWEKALPNCCRYCESITDIIDGKKLCSTLASGCSCLSRTRCVFLFVCSINKSFFIWRVDSHNEISSKIINGKSTDNLVDWYCYIDAMSRRFNQSQ